MVPGFAATAVFGLTIGNRIREFSAATIWSLLFTSVTYGALYALHGALAWIAPDVATIARLDASASGLTLIVAARLGLWGILVGCPLAYLMGLLVRAHWFRSVLRFLTGRGPFVDAWTEAFAEALTTGEPVNVLVNMADGSAYLGLLDNVSELPSQRGIILRNVVKYARDDPERRAPRAFEDRNGRVLITGPIADVHVYSEGFVANASAEPAPPAPPSAAVSGDT